MNGKRLMLATGIALGLLGVNEARAEAGPKTGGQGGSAAVRRGEYLVKFGGCNDCHTPFKMGPKGPEKDMSRMLSGHPEQLEMPPAPALPPGPWMATMSATMTSFAGPWGVSFAANLTPDKDTGLGNWTEQNFVETMRNGRHLGRGRPILPPMPYPSVGGLTDPDLKAVFAYLRSIPPLKNRVPEPRPPPAATAEAMKPGASNGSGSGIPAT
jgi:mono/diheme cytochrome c family protein